MPQGSQPGERRGGRTAGTPNKRTVELVERLAELACDPVEGLVRIANDPATDAALRARVYADLLPYLFPRRKSVELADPNGDPVQLIVRWQSPESVQRDDSGAGNPAGEHGAGHYPMPLVPG